MLAAVEVGADCFGSVSKQLDPLSAVSMLGMLLYKYNYSRSTHVMAG